MTEDWTEPRAGDASEAAGQPWDRASCSLRPPSGFHPLMTGHALSSLSLPIYRNNLYFLFSSFLTPQRAPRGVHFSDPNVFPFPGPCLLQARRMKKYRSLPRRPSNSHQDHPVNNPSWHCVRHLHKLFPLVPKSMARSEGNKYHYFTDEDTGAQRG